MTSMSHGVDSTREAARDVGAIYDTVDADVLSLSVVVPSVNGMTDLERTLQALSTELSSVPMEVLVVDRVGESLRATLRAQFPWVRVLEAPSTTTIPAMRQIAFEAASGRSIAVIEDHIIVPRGWARAMVDAQREAPVVGGSIDNGAVEHVVDWAAFLCEYSHCLAPLPEGPSAWLTGNNVVYRKSTLDRYRARLSPFLWEDHLHRLMRDDGVVLLCRPDIVVTHRQHVGVGEYLSQRYLYARSFAGARVDGLSALVKAAYGVGAMALPPVLLFRIVTRVLAKARYRAELTRSLPLIALFVCAWALGEVVGSWFGAGNALERVR